MYVLDALYIFRLLLAFIWLL